MAAISAFRVTRQSQIFSHFFRNRIQCIALYQLHTSQALLNLCCGYYSCHDASKSDLRRQKVLECILTGDSKLYLGKVYTEEQINKLSAEEVDKIFSNYEAKLSGQMVKSLGKCLINMYSMGACVVLGISNPNALSEDLETDPFLNSTLQRFTCELYYWFGSF